MPPPDAGRALTKEEVDLLRRWIDQGAEYAPPWAFTKPVRDRFPNVRDKSWVKNPLDAFAFTMWMGGGGIRPGLNFGSTDEIGYYPAENPVSVRDLQATILHQLGLDPFKFGVMRSGLNSRLIGPTSEGKVRPEIIA